MTRALVPFEELMGCQTLAQAGIEVALYRSPDDRPDVDDVQFAVLPGRSVSDGLALFAAMSELQVVQVLGAGVDHVLGRLPTGVALCNAPDLHAGPTAELGVSLILASLNHTAAWAMAQDNSAWSMPPPRSTLSGKTVLLLGYGAVGQALEGMLAGFNLRMLRVARHGRDGVAPAGRLIDLLPEADIVVVTVALTEHTRGLVGETVLRRMRDGALLVNLARGPVVDTEDLVRHLHRRRLTAALDVTDPEPLPPGHSLWTAPGVLISPHVGGKTDQFRPRAVAFLRDQLLRYAAGAEPRHVVRDRYDLRNGGPL